MKQKLLFIGNNNGGGPTINGEFAKVRLWLNIFANEKDVELIFIDLHEWKRKPFKTFFAIINSIKNVDCILLMCAVNGARFLIPIINLIIKNKKKKFVYSFIGCGPLNKVIKNLSEEQSFDFLIHQEFCNKKDSKMGRELNKLNALLAETDTFAKTINEFYNISNCITIDNFRDVKIQEYKPKLYQPPVKLIFLSRVSSIKGIFDILEVVSKINISKPRVLLDIYGPILMDEEEKKVFLDYINKVPEINYFGILDMLSINDLLKKYDLLVFPTRYLAEGTPGIISEALLNNLPIISSSFPQANDILKNGIDSILFEFRNIVDLQKKLESLINDIDLIEHLRMGTYKTNHRFTYESTKKRLFNVLFD